MHFVTRGEHLFHAEKHSLGATLHGGRCVASSEGHEDGESHTALNSQSTCKFSDVDDSLCLPDPVIHRDVAPITDCIEMFVKDDDI